MANNDDDAAVAANEPKDTWNYALLVTLYTLQGIPMGLSASIPFLIQQKVRSSLSDAATGAGSAAAANKLSYNANAIFALCSWPFSLKLLWAPIVDSCFLRSFGRRKSWLVPMQAIAGLLMVAGADFVERQLGLGYHGTTTSGASSSINVKGVTGFFFALYFLMATQDIAVDGWALTMLQKKNRGRGPVCNSVGQNIGYFLSFVGFLALNDADSCESLWRPLLRLPSQPDRGMVSLGGFMRFMGYFMLVTTTAVALFKREVMPAVDSSYSSRVSVAKKDDDSAAEIKDLDASEIGLKETYHRLWAVCQLTSVRWLFLVLLTYRLPTSLNDNVKFLKAVEFGLSKSTTAVRWSIRGRAIESLLLLKPTHHLSLRSALVTDSHTATRHFGTHTRDQVLAQFSPATIHGRLQVACHPRASVGCPHAALFAARQANQRRR